ncbi:STAS domain-containing protein [Actinomadura sp. NEAU-AAG7]|uniref:STAS domain-containing protein n=1 Tax=Actinomadura sp. NEAU-AAG7 TaxID=2839640 RepID=UPI001BE43BCB|nr:STAS domain-containing protein [Actinomadura sp. NEAU-AAG7]MBT2207848.1 STAS domain-containing protein [Actinomadura sp. NEAU-AAG7]
MTSADRPAPPTGLSRERRPGATVVALRGELDMATAPALREALRIALRDPGALVVIDLADVTFCDASGLALLVGTRRRTEREGAAVVLAAPRPQLARLLEISGLDRYFSVHRTVEAAGLAGPGGGSAAA